MNILTCRVFFCPSKQKPVKEENRFSISRPIRTVFLLYAVTLFCGELWITMVVWWGMVGYNGKHVGESGKLFTTFLLTTWDGSQRER